MLAPFSSSINVIADYFMVDVASNAVIITSRLESIRPIVAWAFD